MSDTIEKLTPKQELFCLEYLKDLNATKAAIRAGYSEKTAYSIASENLRKPEVVNRLQVLMEERTNRTRVTADYVIQELKSIAEDDIQNYLTLKADETGKLTIVWKNLEGVNTKNISELQQDKDGAIRIKRYSRDAAVVQLGRHLGLFDSSAKAHIERVLLEAYTAGTITDEHLQKIADLIVQNNRNNE